MVSLRAGELPEPNRHHLEQPALDPAREIGVPLHSANQHHAVRFISHAVHERFDPVGCLAERDYFELTYNRATHLGFRNAVVSQHLSLSLRTRCAVATHRWK